MQLGRGRRPSTSRRPRAAVSSWLYILLERRLPPDENGAVISTKIRGLVAEFRAVAANPNLRRLELAYAGSITSEWAFTVALAAFSFSACAFVRLSTWKSFPRFLLPYLLLAKPNALLTGGGK